MLEIDVKKNGRVLSTLRLVNDRTGDRLIGHYNATFFIWARDGRLASKQECRVANFPRNAGPEALAIEGLRAFGHDSQPRIFRELSPSSRELKETS